MYQHFVSKCPALADFAKKCRPLALVLYLPSNSNRNGNGLQSYKSGVFGLDKIQSSPKGVSQNWTYASDRTSADFDRQFDMIYRLSNYQ